MMLRRLLHSILLAGAFCVAAQQPDSLVRVELVDGTVLRGVLVERTTTRVVLDHHLLGRLEIALADIESLEQLDRERPGWRSDPDRNTIMLSPTPQTVGKGDSYFRNFELFFLNFGVGVNDRLDLSCGVLFPTNTDANMLALGAKFMLLDRTRQPFGLAVAGNVAKLDDIEFGSGVVVAGIGSDRHSLNVSVHQSFLRDRDPASFLMVGADLQSGPSTKVLAEFTTGLNPLFDDEDDEIDGFFNFGFRWFGEESSFTLTGIRPLGVDTNSFIAFPLAMYSRHF